MGESLVAWGKAPILEQGGPQEPERDSENPEMAAEQGSELPFQVASTNKQSDKRKQRGSEFYREIGRKGGKKTQEVHGNKHLQSLAKEGGKANADNHDHKYFSQLGKKGGEETRERYGTQHFRNIGREGGKKPRKRRKKTDDSETL